MATLSVVSYAPHNKLNILQQSTNDNTDKREILIMRKKQKLLPATMSGNTTTLVNNQNNNIVNMSKVRKGKTKEKVTNPPPMAVARRNARERNRVKQVNNGFATLRQHIPSEIAAAFENAGNGRGSSKKLSKVETLRMAVEYIRSLEDLLTSDEGESSGNTSGSSMASYPSPQSSSINQGYTFSLQSPLLEDDDDFSNPATPMPIPPIGTQYARIPGTNTFQLIAPPGYEDEENIQPMLGSNQDFILTHPILLDPNLGYITTHLIEASSMSPYSEQSISPSAHVGAGDVTAFIPMMDGSAVYEGQLTMKKEIEDPVIEQSEEMIDVMHWWEQEQRVRHNSLV